MFSNILRLLNNLFILTYFSICTLESCMIFKNVGILIGLAQFLKIREKENHYNAELFLTT